MKSLLTRTPHIIRMMQINYALSQADFFESTIAIRNRKKWAKWVFD